MASGNELISEIDGEQDTSSMVMLCQSIEKGNFSEVGALSTLSATERYGLLTQFPFLVSSLIGGGYYREAHTFLSDHIRFVGDSAGVQDDMVGMVDPIRPLDPVTLRASCEREFLNTMMTGDVTESLQRLKALRSAAEDPFSRAFGQDLLARALLCGYATGFLGKAMGHEMRTASEESVELWRQAGDRSREVKALVRLAEHYQRQGELLATELIINEAFRRWDGEAEVAPLSRGLRLELSYRVLEAAVLRRAAVRDASTVGRFFDETRELLTEAQHQDAPLAALFIVESLSRVAAVLGRDPAPLFLELGALAEKTLNQSASFQTSQGLGTLYFGRGELRRAQNEFERARVVGARSGMPIMHSTAILGLLQVAVHQGRFEDAVALATEVERLSYEFPVTRTALGLSVAGILAQMGRFAQARESCGNLLAAVRAQEDMRLIGQILFFRGHIHSVEQQWSAASRDWRAAKRAQERVHDVPAQVMTLRALSQAALMEQADARQGNGAQRGATEGENGEGRTRSPEQRALDYLSEAEALLLTRSACAQPSEHNLQLGGVALAKAQILVRAGDNTAALKKLGEARQAYLEAESGCDVAITDSLTGLVLLEIAAKGNPILFPESVSSLERAAYFFERHQLAQLLWKVRFYESRSYFLWGGAESMPKAKVARWQQADAALHQAADILDRLKGYQQPQAASTLASTPLDALSSGVTATSVYEFGIELSANYLRDEEGVERWKRRAR